MSKGILNPEDVLLLNLTQKTKDEVHHQQDIPLKEKEMEERTVVECHAMTDMKEDVLLMRGAL